MAKLLQFIGGSTFVSPVTKNQIMRATDIAKFDAADATALLTKKVNDSQGNPIPQWQEVKPTDESGEDIKYVYDFTKAWLSGGNLPRIGNERRVPQSGKPGNVEETLQSEESSDMRVSDLDNNSLAQVEPGTSTVNGGVKLPDPEPNREAQTTGNLSTKTMHQGAKEANDPPTTAIHKQAIADAPDTVKDSKAAKQGAALIEDDGGPKLDGEPRDLDDESEKGIDAASGDMRKEDLPDGGESQGKNPAKSKADDKANGKGKSGATQRVARTAPGK